jgi:Domain of unknown function (DUF4105)
VSAIRRIGGQAVRGSLAVLATAAVPLAARVPPAVPPSRLPAASVPAIPPSRLPGEPGSELTIYVMTMGVGAEVWERFGHNAIIVEDRSEGTAIAYNYGMFSFRQESFLLRFIQGRMDYWMAGYPAEEEVPRYRAARRSVWRQELNLTPSQRLALRDFLSWNALDDNKFYRYDYYRDNCSTRVRDAIDGVVAGAVAAQSDQPASGDYRFHTLRLVAANRLLYLGLALIEGHPVDVPITRWDEMFLPVKLRDYLRDVKVPDTTGALVPLVRREETLYESTAYPVPDAPPPWGLAFLAIGMAIGGGFWWGGSNGRVRRVSQYLLLVGGSFWCLLTGVAGAIMAGLWAFTDHAVAAQNENVLQCSVAALVLAAVLPFALGDRPWALTTARVFALLVGGLSLLGLFLKVLPWFGQANGQVLALFVPANLGLMAGVLAWVNQRET